MLDALNRETVVDTARNAKASRTVFIIWRGVNEQMARLFSLMCAGYNSLKSMMNSGRKSKREYLAFDMVCVVSSSFCIAVVCGS